MPRSLKGQNSKTIQAAANKAQPGDTITVYEGVYRERVDPPRGGTSDVRRITYQTARGEKVVIAKPCNNRQNHDLLHLCRVAPQRAQSSNTKHANRETS